MQMPLTCKETVYKARIKKTFDKKDSYAMLTIYFDKLEIEKVTESPAYDSTRFMADIGGLVGLLMGMSLLSVVEVIICVVLYALDKLCLLVMKLT